MSTSLFDLSGTVAVVTGGSRGIGRAIAISLAQAGADVAVVSRNGAADETVAAITAAGRRAFNLAVDLSDPARAAPMVAQVTEQLGRLDILVNNAGIISRAPALETTPEDWAAVIDVNLNSVWACAQAAGRHMVAQGSGKIITIGSLLSFQGGIRAPAYAAAKHAVVGLTKALANEWAPLGINVNAIAPGYFATDNTAALRADPDRSRQIGERIPAGRWGRPEDLIGATVFLASRASNYVHGHTLVVDGGWMAR